jgi:hypothetical protein
MVLVNLNVDVGYEFPVSIIGNGIPLVRLTLRGGHCETNLLPTTYMLTLDDFNTPFPHMPSTHAAAPELQL